MNDKNLIAGKQLFEFFCRTCCKCKSDLFSFFSTYLGDLSRIPEILADAVIEGAGLDSDIADDDDEMSSPVKKGKHRRNPGY